MPAERAEAVASAERIYVIGPPGSGKSTVARRLGELTGLPVHDLDLVLRVAGGNSPLRPADERTAQVRRIGTDDRWIVEGVHLGWTEPLMLSAQAIVWLDHLAWPRLAYRMARRFAGGAATEARGQRGRRRFVRLNDYRRHLAELLGTLRDARAYRTAAKAGPRGTPSRRATLRALAGHRDRLVHVRRQAELDELIRLVASSQPTTAGAGRDRAPRPAG